MAKRRHKKVAPVPALVYPDEIAIVDPGARERVLWDLCWDLFYALLITALLLGINLSAERTSLMQQIDLIGYRWLQNRLYANLHPDELPVQILDISEMRPISVQGALTPITPRDRLLELIQVLADQKPAAVGIDIDFSQNEAGLRDPRHDLDFFQSIAKLQARVPVFLGIADSAGSPPSEWLPNGYQKLAACILVPSNDRRRMPKAIRRSDSEPGVTMSVALASSVLHNSSVGRLWPAWAVRRSENRRLSDRISVDEFAVDYSPTKTLDHDKLSTISSQSVIDMGKRFKGKVVLIGDATLDNASRGDSFQIPSDSGEYPGIYFHACAVYTLLSSPLYELTLAGRISLDLMLSLVALGLLFGIRGYYVRRTSKEINTTRLQPVIVSLVAIVTLAGGLILVASAGILWDDFLIVCLALVIHPHLEKYIKKLFLGVCKTAPTVWNWLVPDSKKGGVPVSAGTTESRVQHGVGQRGPERHA